MLSPMIASAAQGSRVTYADCPACGYKESFSATVKDGKSLYYCHAGCDQRDLLAALGGERPRLGRPIEPRPAPLDKDVAGKRDCARQLWDRSLPARGTYTESYLQGRGMIGAIPTTLRFLPNLAHRPSGTFWPVMLAGVTDTQGNVLAIHRTYLARDGRGKAPVAPAKMTLAPIAGLSCHLAPAAYRMAVAEGIETGLSFQQGTGIPTWAALSSGNMTALVLPPLPLASEVIIAADGDPAGLSAANEAAQRFMREGRKVEIAAAPNGMDFNDLLLQQIGGAL